MPICNHASGINSQQMSALGEHWNDTCGKPAAYAVGKKNATAFFLCEAHANYYKNNRSDSPWNEATASD